MKNGLAAFLGGNRKSRFLRPSRFHAGQTLVEYALILAIISIVAVGIMINLGKQITGVYSSINSVVKSAAASH